MFKAEDGSLSKRKLAQYRSGIYKRLTNFRTCVQFLVYYLSVKTPFAYKS